MSNYLYLIALTLLLGLTAAHNSTNVTQVRLLSDECNLRYQQAFMDIHHQARAYHQAGDLQINYDLMDIAQSYANKIAATNNFIHSNNGYGENLAMISYSSPPEITPDYCSEIAHHFGYMWYEEVQYYNYNNPVFSSQTGHFTQMVWRSSVQIGFGAAFDASGRTLYAVANYNPSGNVQGQFQNNVLPPASQESKLAHLLKPKSRLPQV